MDIEFFAMSVFAGIMGSYGLVSMALWADSLGLPRLDFSRNGEHYLQQNF